MLSPAELDTMRATARLTLTSHCEILRKVPGDGLSTPDSWPVIATVLCSVAPRGSQPSERFVAGQAVPRSLWAVRMDPDELAAAAATVDSAHRIRWVEQNRTFGVVDSGSRSLEILRTVICEETA